MVTIFWKSGRKVDFKLDGYPIDFGDVNEISYIKATDDDYDMICELFRSKIGNIASIPIIENKTSMFWYGDIAKTIYLNLNFIYSK
ncbi:MAG: hypothetical protein JXA99_01975 [Candidatus Lokiarchaeota archaeon]|nr:hypothetical protein [Candidatus Lokiarchaeota archaeon]